MSSNYYRILGVVEDAEDIVIRAAYRALSQKYHPDKWTGAAEEAHRKMAELNVAYDVLSSPSKRQDYDAKMGAPTFESEEPPTEDALLSSVERDWQLVLGYYPNIKELALELSKISKLLEYSFKATLLERKNFHEAEVLAAKLENNYLNKYFGTAPLIRSFAKKLILLKNGAAAKELNMAINVLGTRADPFLIIDRITEKYQLKKYINSDQAWRRINSSAQIIMGSSDPGSEILYLLSTAGCTLKETGFFNITTSVCLDGITKTFKSKELMVFGRKVAQDILRFQTIDVVKTHFHAQG